MTREETAVKKFEESFTDQQKELVKKKILHDAFMDAHGIMRERYEACLYPSINPQASAGGIAQLMFNYGYATCQLWGREDDAWVMYKYNK